MLKIYELAYESTYCTYIISYRCPSNEEMNYI